MQGVPDLLAVRHSHITANATFRQITEQDAVVQRSGLYLRETFLPMGIFPVIFPGTGNGLVFGSKTAPYPCDEPGLRLEIPAADKLPARVNMSPPCPVPKSCHISLRTFNWNEAVRSSRYGARYQYSSPVFLPVHIPSVPENGDWNVSYLFYSHKRYGSNGL